jgi:hypothetical protein
MIRSRALPTLLLATMSTAALGAGCSDGDDHQTAEFATASDAQLRRTIGAMRVGDLATLYIIGAFTSGTNSDACPGIVSSGAVTTITGGCTNDDGDRLDGRIVVTNVQPVFATNPSYDPAQPSTVEAFDFTVVGTDGTESIDGKVTQTVTGGSADNGGVVTGSTDVTVEGIAVHSEIGFSCDASELCTLRDESWIDVDGLGGAVLTGTFRFDDPATGTITATGADTLVMDVATTDDDCVTFRIDGGATRQLCDPDAPSAKRRTPVAGPAAAGWRAARWY